MRQLESVEEKAHGEGPVGLDGASQRVKKPKAWLTRSKKEKLDGPREIVYIRSYGMRGINANEERTWKVKVGPRREAK